jgi:hypothetical protein
MIRSTPNGQVPVKNVPLKVMSAYIEAQKEMYKFRLKIGAGILFCLMICTMIALCNKFSEAGNLIVLLSSGISYLLGSGIKLEKNNENLRS